MTLTPDEHHELNRQIIVQLTDYLKSKGLIGAVYEIQDNQGSTWFIEVRCTCKG